MLPGASTRSGWSRWPSSSTPSTRRGPGREKVEAASTAKTRRRRGASIRSQCSSVCALRLVDVPAAGHRDDDVGAEARRARPSATSGDFRPGGPATSSPPAIEIISGIQWPPTKGGSSHSSAITRGRAAPATAARTVASRPSSSPRSSWRRVRDRGGLAEPDHVLEHLAERARVLLEHPRPARQPRGDLDHVLVGDRADVADRLGDDQVGRELGEQLLVELVERPALADGRLHRRRRSPPASSPGGRTVRVRWGRDRASGG